MSEELDRRIAVEVMGEPCPSPPVGALLDDARADAPDNVIHRSAGGNWYLWYDPSGSGHFGFWRPVRFSTDLDQAMRAADEYLDADKRHVLRLLHLTYDRDPMMRNEPWRAAFVDLDDELWGEARGDGSTLPEAVCNLLLALVEEAG